jgi:ABC-type microcin C transport system duplicated ATPase subunit YejF
MKRPMLEIDGLCVDYPARRSQAEAPGTAALQQVSFTLEQGRSLAVVGESGSGKSTLARAILRLVSPSAGAVRWFGESIHAAGRRRLREIRSESQIVFQDPVGSLDPRMTVERSLWEALEAHGAATSAHAATAPVNEALLRVALDPSLRGRYPHELSGGQCQRVAIARATIVSPRLLICDEATSALDVSVQAQIINLINQIRLDSKMALMFITHNLAVARLVCEDVLVLKAGRVVEGGPIEQVFRHPVEPYTRELLSSAASVARISPRP